MPESQLTKLRGVVCQIRFKTDLPRHAAVVKKLCSGFFHFMDFCTFGSGTPNSVVLGDARRSACRRRLQAKGLSTQGFLIVNYQNDSLSFAPSAEESAYGAASL